MNEHRILIQVLKKLNETTHIFHKEWICALKITLYIFVSIPYLFKVI